LDEYRKYIEKDPAFERRFQQVMVKEPNVADCVSILRGLKDRYESHFGVRILDSALVIAAQLSNRYITNRFLPDKAIGMKYSLFFHSVNFPVFFCLKRFNRRSLCEYSCSIG
jgi:ATP-dependent Clp protease ATP-binding subunit ClpB